MARVSQALKRVEADRAELLPDESILAACRAVGHTWRRRQLGPVQTIRLFALQVMACNTAISHLRLLAGEAFSVAAVLRGTHPPAAGGAADAAARQLGHAARRRRRGRGKGRRGR